MLRQITAAHILEALETGKMRTIGASLTAAQRETLAKSWGLAESLPAASGAGVCSSSEALRAGPGRWNGWGLDAANTRYRDARKAGLDRESVPKPKLKWAFGFSGATTAFGQPTASGRRLFVGSAEGAVYSLNANMGRVYWKFAAPEGVRTAIVLSEDGQRAYSGDLHANVCAGFGR